MTIKLINSSLLFAAITLSISFTVNATENLKSEVEKSYNSYLKDLFVHFYQNPELSLVKTKTASRLKNLFLRIIALTLKSSQHL
jgi:hippurate hydrolase